MGSKRRLKIDVPEHILKGIEVKRDQPMILLTMAEFAEYCGISRQRVYHLHKKQKAGELKTRIFPTPGYYYKTIPDRNAEQPLFTLRQAEYYLSYLKLLEQAERAYDEERELSNEHLPEDT